MAKLHNYYSYAVRALIFFVSFLLASTFTELPPLSVSAEEPVPPSEGAGIVPIEVVVVEVMETGTCMQ